MRRCFSTPALAQAQRLVLPGLEQPIHGGRPLSIRRRAVAARALERAGPAAENTFRNGCPLCSNERWAIDE